MRLFLSMAERTGTLWEHNDICASCNHSFALYTVKWLVYALICYDVLNGGNTLTEGVGIDCEIAIPIGSGDFRYLTVKNNQVTMQ